MMEDRDGRKGKEGERINETEETNSRNKEGVVIRMKGKRREEERAEREAQNVEGRMKSMEGGGGERAVNSHESKDLYVHTQEDACAKVVGREQINIC